jgi:DNA end-binding protein Ku
MRAIWSGAISFGLVNIPIKLYSASLERRLNFDMLHKTDLSPIRFARICRLDGREIPYEDIVKGYEYQPGDYVVLTDQDFNKANVRKTKTIDIEEFTDAKQIDPMYYVKPYYLEPGKGAEKPYAVLREALKKSGKVAIAKFVLRNREHLAALTVQSDVLVLNQLRFSDEIKKPEDIKIPDKKTANNREVDMALALIDQLTAAFKPSQFKDEYTQELKKVIDARIKGRRPKAKGKAPRATRVPDLLNTLQKSLKKQQRAARSARPSRSSSRHQYQYR